MSGEVEVEIKSVEEIEREVAALRRRVAWRALGSTGFTPMRWRLHTRTVTPRYTGLHLVEGDLTRRRSTVCGLAVPRDLEYHGGIKLLDSVSPSHWCAVCETLASASVRASA